MLPIDPKTIKTDYVKNPFDKAAPFFYLQHFADPLLTEPLNRLASLLPKGSTILDAGASTGGQTEKLLSLGFAVTADLTPLLLQTIKD